MPQGKWSDVKNWPIIAVSSTVLPNGDVLSHGADINGVQGGMYFDIWDPITNVHTTIDHAHIQTNTFCAGTIIDPFTGNALMIGGDTNQTIPGAQGNLGITNVETVDWRTNTFAATQPMEYGRWYPTAITLGNGKIFVDGGVDGNNTGSGIPEVYTSGVGWHSLVNAYSNDVYLNWWYPRLWQSSNGNVEGFVTNLIDPGGRFIVINPNGDGNIQVGGITPFSNSYTMPSIEFAPDKILVTTKEGNAWIMDISGTTPTYTQTQGFGQVREWSNLTLLADGTVMLSGGSGQDNALVNVTNDVKIWHPDTGQWTEDASAAIPRLYHSNTVLLPDGRVLSDGGGATGIGQSGGPLANLNAEIYSPGYLFNADGTPAVRPVIENGPKAVANGSEITVTLDNSAEITHLRLIKYESATHSFDPEARDIDLAFHQGGNNQLVADLPLNGNLLTPGYWMLFAINHQGTPSIAHILHIGANGDAPPNIVEPNQLQSVPQNTGDIFQTVNVDDFVTMNGTATYSNHDQSFTLTPNTQGSNGNVTFDQRLDLTHDFHVAYQMNFANLPNGADGMTFRLHNDPAGANTLGGGGGGLGAAGISDGVGIAFDVYQGGAPFNDIPGSHTNFIDTAAPPQNRDITKQVSLGDLRDGTWHNVVVTWNAATQTLSYTFDGQQEGQIRNVLHSYLNDQQYAYLSFTGATGGNSLQQQVRVSQVQAALQPLPNGGLEPTDDGCVFNVANTKDNVALLGSALYDVGKDSFVLTQNEQGQSGGMTFDKRLDLTHDFNIVFQVNAGNNANGGDGLAFVLHNDARGLGALGGGGGAYGALGLANGLGISFDTFQNAGIDQFGKHTNFFATDTNLHPRDITAQTNLGNFTDGNWHSVDVKWDAVTKTMDYWVDGHHDGTLNSNIVNQYLGGSQFAYLGFTAATGGSINEQQVRLNALDTYFEGDLNIHNCKQDLSNIDTLLTINGNASQLDANDRVFQLTPDQQGQLGGVTFNQRIDLLSDFAVSFDVYFGAKNNGGDGMALVLHNDPGGVKALGGGGGALGAVGLQNGLAIEFDTYRNGAPYFDIADDHSQFLHTDPAHNHAGNGGNIGIGNQTDLGNIHDGHWHNVLVTWNPENTTLTYWFDGKQAGQMTTDIRTQHLGDNFAYLSLTGAGGGSSNVQEVRVDQLSALWEGEVHTSNGVHAHA